MNKTKKILPELRFPEFKDAGEWIEIPIANVLIESRIPSNVNDPNKRITVRLNQKGIEKREVRGTEAENATYFFVRRKKQFIYGKQNLYKGAFGIIPDELDGFESSQDLPAFDFKKGFSPEYFVYYLGQEYIFPSLEKISTGTGSKRIQPKDFFKVQFPFPKLPEQQKIAACLSSLDELISAHSQKLELLKAHKKGLMQNLFPQEGKKVPKLRFKEFEDSGEWKEETLGKVCDFKSTNSLSREHLSYEKGIVKNIHYGDIHTTFSTLFDITKEKVPFIKYSVPVKIKKDNYCIEGDIIFADASEDIDDIGKSIEIINLNNEKLVSGLHTLLARQRKQKLAIGFGGYLFKSDWVRKQIQREAQGAKVLGISATRISRIRILFPQNIIEQQKIASCLSSLDELITAQSKKIEQLKQHKKGLMQGLFPKINE